MWCLRALLEVGSGSSNFRLALGMDLLWLKVSVCAAYLDNKELVAKPKTVVPFSSQLLRPCPCGGSTATTRGLFRTALHRKNLRKPLETEYYCNHPTGRQQNMNDSTFLISWRWLPGRTVGCAKESTKLSSLSMNWNEVTPFSHEDATVDGTPRLDTTLWNFAFCWEILLGTLCRTRGQTTIPNNLHPQHT